VLGNVLRRLGVTHRANKATAFKFWRQEHREHRRGVVSAKLSARRRGLVLEIVRVPRDRRQGSPQPNTTKPRSPSNSSDHETVPGTWNVDIAAHDQRHHRLEEIHGQSEVSG
jgi:hypothetical protein